MALPSISVVTPSFNQSAFLERTIQSIVAQDYPALDYRILDGGSTDGSVEIIKKYEDRLASWSSEQDEGQADAIAKGFAACEGEVLAYLNSDDVYVPGALQAVGEAFAADPALDLIYGDIVYIDANDTPLAVDVLPRYRWNDLRRVCVIPQPAAFWRRSAYDRVGGINKDFHFALDYDLFLRIAEHGKVRHLPKILASFRVHGASKTTTERETWGQENKALRERFLGSSNWSMLDTLALKSLTARQIACLGLRTLMGERFPSYVPVRWNRLSRPKLARAAGRD